MVRISEGDVVWRYVRNATDTWIKGRFKGGMYKLIVLKRKFKVKHEIYGHKLVRRIGGRVLEGLNID